MIYRSLENHVAHESSSDIAEAHPRGVMPVFFSQLNDIVRTAHQQCINAQTERDTAIVVVPLNQERERERARKRANCREQRSRDSH